MAKVKWTIYVTPEEKEAIQYFCTFHDMIVAEAPAQVDNSMDIVEASAAEAEVVHNAAEPLHVQGDDQAEDHEECPHCFQRPCITNEEVNRQLWWLKESQPPSLANSAKRKKMYRNFYSMLYNQHAWRDPRYLQRKQEALERDKGRKKKFMWHRRELMPNCVLKLVRGWLPNPAGVPYMGHYWE